mmetsp:Transcript_80397/g.208944  ORF Transcript_80397/g.208944 Transcript_80397/m.208944 type:complete len:223 (-) Transcript_80397:488-1156(-)
MSAQSWRWPPGDASSLSSEPALLVLILPLRAFCIKLRVKSPNWYPSLPLCRLARSFHELELCRWKLFATAENEPSANSSSSSSLAAASSVAIMMASSGAISCDRCPSGIDGNSGTGRGSSSHPSLAAREASSPPEAMVGNTVGAVAVVAAVSASRSFSGLLEFVEHESMSSLASSKSEQLAEYARAHAGNSINRCCNESCRPRTTGARPRKISCSPWQSSGW